MRRFDPEEYVGPADGVFKKNQVELNHCGVTILSMDESLIINDWFEKTSLSRRLITVNVSRNIHALR